MDIGAVVGLGNPGPEYALTRHNVGFRVVDELARRWRASVFSHRYRALVARRAGGRRLLLVKPQTYMNLSGDALRLLCDGEALKPEQCLVVVDDVELPLGQLRLREAGGAGTHNGLRSIVERLGEGFPRLRVGVAGESPWRDLADYVLAPFEGPEEEAVGESLVRAADCVEMALHAGLARAATRFNRNPAPPPQE
ncbi:MAG: aminoacyl-tRNA hydrolase [Acidobacteriota bacterium]